MKKLLNTLYVLSEDAWLSLKGETVEVHTEAATQNIPLHTLESIVCFSYKGASPALMGKCAEAGIALSFFDRNGRYLASVGHLENGNVHLRRTQFRCTDDEAQALQYARSFIAGKLYNAKYVLLRAARDHALQTDEAALRSAAGQITEQLHAIQGAASPEALRGIEGVAAAAYFGVFDELILQKNECFAFAGRNRRPPTDPVNALLSFAYALLANDCASALHAVGLDPYVGFFHTDRPGRKSLALDLMEELRAPFADRFVLTLLNNRILGEKDFKKTENGAVLLTDNARRTFLSEWQQRKKEVITHPYLEEKLSWGLLPFAQALLLARSLRGDLDDYPPFFWK